MKINHHRMCELCDQRAAVYCPSDSAFLCLRCDSRVHGANFLVARHLRLPLCSSCDDDRDNNESWSSSSHSFDSACVSSTDQSSATTTTHRKTDPSRATTKRRVVIKRATATNSADVTFLRWWKELGLRSNDVNYVGTSASEALGFCMARMPEVPLRVSMAAAFWFGVRGERRREVTWREVRRVKEITGVPVRMILAVDAKLRRELRVARRGNKAAEMKEGWAES